ncbi:MAG: polysaccharide biosynthesis C-terminal domain-containing protein [Tannerellaceae bacterium]|nr:polysaccharide biosynthesis C-terminal domain-containing protein [Tannerellaceae bacterium]
MGLLDAGTKISESVWHISRSTSNIEYSRVAGERDPQKQADITLKLFKLTGCALLLIMAVILLIPEVFYTRYLFSPEFTGIKYVILGLSVGCIALGSNSILSHYFIATGKIRYSTYCSFTGLVLLLISGFFLIPVYGVLGSAISSSIAFSGMLLFSIFVFKRHTGIGLPGFLPDGNDWCYLRQEIGKLFTRRN